MSDEELVKLKRGGHDPEKVYAAYKAAVEHKGSPTVILAHTVKGYGLGSAEARNATHQEKKLADQSLTAFRSRFAIPVASAQERDAVRALGDGSGPIHDLHVNPAAKASRVLRTLGPVRSATRTSPFGST